MKNPINPLFLVFIFALLAGCDQQDSDPAPAEKQLRADKMSYGDIAYRQLKYNDQNKITHVLLGSIDGEDTVKTLHEVYYNGDRISKINIQDEWELQYLYDGTLLVETHELMMGELFQKNKYSYDGQKRVITWEAFQKNSEGELAPVTKNEYTYSAANNVVQIKLYGYLDDSGEPTLISTIDYLEFDTKKNSFNLFFGNLYHPYHKMFQNNPHKMVVTQGNGTKAEEHYAYTYNGAGFVTKQESLTGGHPIEYTFQEF